MRTAGSIFIGVVLGVTATLLAPPVRADAGSDAEVLITKGVELREKGRDDEALAVFRQALAKAPSARARAQVGLAEQALGMWVLAETDLSQALAAEADPWIARNKAALEGALGVVRRRITTLEVRGADNAEVFVDGVKLGTGAGPFRIEAGRRTLEVRAAGFQPTTRMVELPPGGVARETVTLVPVSVSKPADGTPLSGPGGVNAPEDRPHPGQDPGASQRLLGWAFVGTGAALLATGAVGLVIRKGIIDDYNRTCPGLGVEQPASCNDQVSSASTWLTISILTLVGGGVFAAGGVVLVAAAPSAATSADPPAKSTAGAPPRLACSPTAGGIACAGAF